MANRNWRTAAEHAQNCLQAGDDRPLVYGYLAMAKAHLGEEAEAIRLAETVRRADPENVDNLMLTAHVLLLCNRTDAAEKVLFTARRIAPDDLGCRRLLCHAAAQKKDAVALSERIEAFADLGGAQVDVLRFEGLLAMILDQPEIAETAFRGVLREVPEDFTAHIKLADAALMRGDARTAHTHASTAARVDPENLEARNLVRALDGSKHWIHRAWFRLSCWMVLPGFRWQRWLTLGVLFFILIRLPPLAGGMGTLFMVIWLTCRWYIHGIVEVLKAAEGKVEISADY